MINRVLIRTKVVQMLYSYLLTRSEFKIESAPTHPSRDNKCAYSTYIDLLLLVLEVSGFNVKGHDSASPLEGIGENRYLTDNRMIRALLSDEKVRALIMRYGPKMCRYDSIVASLYEQVIRSSAYKSYIRLKNRDITTDTRFWSVIIATIFAKSPELQAIMRQENDFTLVGFERGVEMLVKTLGDCSDTKAMLVEAKHSLEHSLDKAYELYQILLLLPVELTRLQDQRLDQAKHKYLPTPEDLNPNMRFVDNALVRELQQSPETQEFLEKYPISWTDDMVFLRSMLDKILSSALYQEYMAAPETDYAADCEFWRSVMKNIILPSEDLAEILEMKSVYWNDDMSVIGTFVLKTIKRIATAGEGNWHILPKYKDSEDAAFGADLFSDTVEHFHEYRSYIDRFIDSKQWDSERLAFMDIVIMATAISEFLNYPAIPIAVTMNEYIEIANTYSTHKSGQFVNGLLYSVVNYLKSEGKLLKN